jgi:glycosyltransferase involved in cell wall biosynthesis
VRFVGGIDVGVVEAAIRDLPDSARGRIQFEPRVGWKRGQETLRAADLLLLFQGDDSVLQVPAKFYEYLQTGKPIFAVTERGATTEAIEATGAGLWVDPKDPQRIAETFLRVLELPPEAQAEVRLERESRYHYRVLTASLAAQVRMVVQ